MTTSETITLSPLQRKNLKSHAHHLDPVVMIGNEGLTVAVLKAIDEQLAAHELIKIRVFSDDREQRTELHASICAELGAAPVQHIGKLLVVWRPGKSSTRIDPDMPYLPDAPVAKKPGIQSAPHTPKKLAAAGKTAAKKTVKRKSVTEDTENTLARRIRQATEQSRKRTTRRGARRSR